MHYLRLLTIAGSDSGGGAGIQADLKTFSALKGYGMSVVTSLTAQNTQRIDAVYPIPDTFVARQIDAVMTDLGADAVKTGMLATGGIITIVADRMRRYNVQRFVLDPVMVATSGDPLLQADAIHTLKSDLIPLATVITPNRQEASILLNRTITSDDMEDAARDLLELGCQSALLKGGHFDDTHSDDVLALRLPTNIKVIRFSGLRIHTRNTHGTGCTLSSAIAAFLGKGHSVTEAVRAAKTYIEKAILTGAAFTLGHGHAPVHHFHEWWNTDSGYDQE